MSSSVEIKLKEKDLGKEYAGNENPGFCNGPDKKDCNTGSIYSGSLNDLNKKTIQDSGLKNGPVKSKPNDTTTRLSQFAILQRQRRHCVYLKCVAALIGMIFMTLETELFMYSVITKDSAVSLALKIVVTLSTSVLIVGVIYYHILRYKIYMLKRSRNHDQTSFLLSFLVEFLTCAIHPFPGNTTVTIAHGATTNIDVFLSIAMILRVYLITQFLAERCEVFNNTVMKGFGFINRVNVDAMFVFKTTLYSHPGKVLLCIMFGIILMATFAMQSCESYIHPDAEISPFQHSLWLIVITFLTVGYGDITPNTYCGRFVSVCTGFLGIGMTALLIAVIAQSLELTRAEKNFQNFAKAQVRNRKHQSAAANVIKFSWLVWKNRNKKKGVRSKYMRILSKEVACMKRLRIKQNASLDNNTDLVCIKHLIIDIQRQQDKLQDIVLQIEKKMDKKT